MPRFPMALCALAIIAVMAACGSQSEPLPPAASAPEKSTKSMQQVQAPRTSAQLQLAADMELSGKVKELLQEPARSHVEVAAADGVVTLYGTVDVPAEKERIALLALGVEGVRSVVNNLVAIRGT